MKFTELGLHESLLEAISYMGFEDATPIQEKAIPIVLNNKDLIACAQTGTGKTAAFVLPVLHQLINKNSQKIKALIIAPTRELVIQIDQQIEGICYGTGLASLPIFGGGDGSDWVQQKKALSEGIDIVIATPGKLISHLNLGYVNLSEVTHFILDEADRMLDIGFHDDILKIMSFLPGKRQNLMFSATMPPKIRTFAKRILTDPEEISLAMSKPAEGVLQAAYLVYDHQKTELIRTLISEKEEYESIIIFSSTKKNVSDIVFALKKNNISVEGISSNLKQSDREEVLLKFRNKKFRVLVATDVISRGIDIKDIHLVINFNVPNDAEDYVHRIGRTARASTTGVALTLVNEHEMGSFHKIETLIEKEVIKLPVPDSIGKGPEWKAQQNRKPSGGGGKKKNFNKNKFKPKKKSS